jgi:hypothetical protein
MWCYFRVLLGRALTIERSNELCDCESVTLTFDRSTAEALLLVCPLYLVSKPKKCHPQLQPPSWWRFGLRQPGSHDCFSVRWRCEFGATWVDLNLGPLSIYLFTVRPPADGTSRKCGLDRWGFRNKYVLRYL